ncbi:MULTISPECIES: glycosyltransferase [Vibrio]|uniref:glycosyltransferase n=1 Tax=Vibrio TaxID=662 RepID=UPI001A8E4E3C|nr:MULTISPECIES: glycosyltransferase [Vibrio]MBO0147864.1 glycosyltransferase [Vibrio sp. Vb2424]MCS0038174.1 glycosyltransferase [Vibrio alginolyticus]MDW2369288.1 glycosyltransferase [Vibrio sp. 1078-1]
MKATLICDHALDPRLRKRVAWLSDYGYEVSIFTDRSRGNHFSSDIYQEKDIEDLDYKDFKKSDLVYVSGAKVIVYKFFQLFFLSIRDKKIIYEIPDLPLRSHSSLKNRITLYIFSLIVRLVFKNIVITSPAFLNYLPKGCNYFLSENLPSIDIVKNVKDNKKNKSDYIRIGFVGALRYPKQMAMLIRYCVENNCKAVFFGGPKENEKQLIELCFSQNIEINDLVEFKGSFDQSELRKIYNSIDYVYSVYDSNQPNVKLALPNKLYEAQLFETPIIVSSDTYLSKCVYEGGFGFSVNSCDFDVFTRDMRQGLGKSYVIRKNKVVEKVLKMKSEFMDWLDNIQ